MRSKSFLLLLTFLFLVVPVLTPRTKGIKRKHKGKDNPKQPKLSAFFQPQPSQRDTCPNEEKPENEDLRDIIPESLVE